MRVLKVSTNSRPSVQNILNGKLALDGIRLEDMKPCDTPDRSNENPCTWWEEVRSSSHFRGISFSSKGTDFLSSISMLGEYNRTYESTSIGLIHFLNIIANFGRGQSLIREKFHSFFRVHLFFTNQA